MIIRTEAIVLRSIKYSESSRIATLLTREKGRLSVIAKGARRTNSRFGSTLLPLAYTEAVLYYRPGRSLHTLSQASHLLRFNNMTRDLDRLSDGLRVVELVNALLQEEEVNPGIFNLVLGTLQRLDQTANRFENIWPFFQIRMASMLGFAPQIDRDTLEKIESGSGRLALDTGTILPTGENAVESKRASRKALRAFAVLARTDMETVLRMRLDTATRRELNHLVDAFVRYHVEDAYPSRAGRVLAQLDGRP